MLLTGSAEPESDGPQGMQKSARCTATLTPSVERLCPERGGLAPITQHGLEEPGQGFEAHSALSHQPLREVIEGLSDRGGNISPDSGGRGAL